MMARWPDRNASTKTILFLCKKIKVLSRFTFIKTKVQFKKLVSIEEKNKQKIKEKQKERKLFFVS